MFRIGQAFCAMALLMVGLMGAPAKAQTSSQKPTTVVFVCLHGSVKSQMAAVHFNRIAKERGLPFVALSRGIEVDASIPAGIRQGLAVEGLAPVDDTPRPLVAQEASGAVKVFAFDNVPNDRKGSANIIYWTDVPPATKDYNAARDAIVRHVEEVVTSLSDK